MRLTYRADEVAEHPWACDWSPDELNPGPDCPYCAGEWPMLMARVGG